MSRRDWFFVVAIGLCLFYLLVATWEYYSYERDIIDLSEVCRVECNESGASFWVSEPCRKPSIEDCVNCMCSGGLNDEW